MGWRGSREYAEKGSSKGKETHLGEPPGALRCRVLWKVRAQFPEGETKS